MKALDQKVALVTGASRGIGRAIAERLARDGATVVVNYAASPGKAEEVVAAIESAGGKAVAIGGDVSKVADIRRLFDATQERFGRLDLVVANAATSLFKPHVEVTEAEFDRVFTLNARGTFFVLQEAARRIADGGRIVVLSSAGTASRSGTPGAGVYLGSKAAVEFFVPSLVQELGRRGVTVNLLSPGLTDTDGMIMPPQAVEQVIQRTPLGRLGKPADVADAVAFLVGPDAHWVNGQNLGATGGL